ncbi:hypothetical protein EST38_g9182 [Candolleomyces aberdarensis]|uniref:CCAAT-binding factor domain-containing protein n=1 Tax=Candolleomyces aberdarensis TaxID=2316362 RepID=A0A4V1Q2Y1_9AGAR|nr:hypothetical protein EST38_g9182 [Candolleomyces aberdarensis]
MAGASSSQSWYTGVPTLPPPQAPLPAVSAAELADLTSRASSLHTAECTSYTSSSGGGSSSSNSTEYAFFSKVVQSGTLSDRLSALTLMVQKSPLHNGKALEILRGMAERGKGKGGREESLKALRCIVDWWVGGGAPDRKLKYFRDQPLNHPKRTDQHLIVWYFEDWLKKYFFSVLQILENLSLDTLTYIRTQTLTQIATLLRDKPEQEHNLLRLLVNKLGDPEKSICSRASYHILQILQKHPQMKGIIVREITSIMFHTSASSSSTSAAPAGNKHIRFGDDSGKGRKKEPERKAKNGHVRYYSIITLNQIVLAPGDTAVSLQLINIYFDIFREVLGDQSPSDGDGQDEHEGGGAGEVQVDSKGRVRDKNNQKGKGQKTSGEEVKGAAGFVEVEDSNSKLISAILTGVNRALPFAKLQNADSGVYKHIDTLFTITHKSTFNTSLQALVLIQQIAASLSSTSTSKAPEGATKNVIDRYYRVLYTSLHDPRLSTSSKQAMYLNLLFKSLKQDTSLERVKAVVRRLVQVLAAGASGQTEFVAGGLYLLGELFSTIPGLRAMVTSKPTEKDGEDEKEEYDPKKRDPLHAHASSSPLWELSPLLHHYHPAVALHARQLLSSQPLTASPDLSQNTLSHFLDRFVYKNAKKLAGSKTLDGEDVKGKGGSAMQPAASALEGVKLVKGELGAKNELRVNDPAFWRGRKERDVAADEMFYYKYFTEKSEREKKMADKAGKRKGGEEEDDSEDSDSEDEDESEGSEGGSEVSEGELDEDEVWKAMQTSMPKADGDELLLGSEDDDEIDLNESDMDDDELSLVEGSDNEDLIPVDDIPVSSDSEWGGIEGDTKKRKRGADEKSKRKKHKALPTFASYEEYAKLIEEGPEDDV